MILPGSLSEGSLNGASSSTDPVESARVAAANARRAVHEEAAKLGISLGSAPGSVDAGGDLRAAAALAGLPGAPDDPTDLAFEADRQLAAELATVCALVEREEARRAALRERVAAEAEAAAAAGDAGAQLAVLEEMRDAQRRWESAMEVQLTRLRGAAHEAEERNAVAAAAARGSARRAASREAREGAVADRLAHLQGRVDAMLRAEGVKYPSAERNAESNAPLPPWGAGPGLNPPGPGGKHQKDENTSSSPRGAARTRARRWRSSSAACARCDARRRDGLRRRAPPSSGLFRPPRRTPPAPRTPPSSSSSPSAPWFARSRPRWGDCRLGSTRWTSGPRARVGRSATCGRRSSPRFGAT